MKMIKPSITVKYYIETTDSSGEKWNVYREFTSIQTAIDVIRDLKEEYPNKKFRLILRSEFTEID
jgi:hypothetical protein